MSGSWFNHIYAQQPPVTDFKIGDGATLLHYTDRTACTIVEIQNDGKVLKLQEDSAIRTDSYGMSDAQSYQYEPNPHGAVHTATRRKDGHYRLKGESTAVLIGAREHYHDYSF